MGQAERVVIPTRLQFLVKTVAEHRERDLPATDAAAQKAPGTLVSRAVETVLRRTRIEAPGMLQTGVGRPEAVGSPKGAATRPFAPREMPSPASQTAFSDSEVNRITNRVVQQINRRIVAQRERMGRI